MPWDVLSGEQRELRELVRTLARERIAPRAAEIDATHEFPWDIVELYRDQGIFGLLFEEEHGGTGTGTLLSLIAIEEVSSVIGRINDYQTTIASAVEEQTATTAEMDRNVGEASAGSGNIATTIAGVAAAARSTTESVGESQQAAVELADVSSRLQAVTSQFRV